MFNKVGSSVTSETADDETLLRTLEVLFKTVFEYMSNVSCDVFAVVDPSCWPDVDSQPLSLEDGWRLRVVSAQVYSIVRSRDMQHFERVIGFLETTHRLVPTLVAAIKHMKILFGLKTLVGTSGAP